MCLRCCIVQVVQVCWVMDSVLKVSLTGDQHTQCRMSCCDLWSEQACTICLRCCVCKAAQVCYMTGDVTTPQLTSGAKGQVSTLCLEFVSLDLMLHIVFNCVVAHVNYFCRNICAKQGIMLILCFV